MNISPKERFLDICHFKRSGDLWLNEFFWKQTLEKWVEQGAPKEIIPTSKESVFGGRFLIDYFQFQYTCWLREEILSKIDFVHGIRVETEGARLLVPACEPKIISEDESTVTLRNATGQIVKYLKGDSGNMPMYLGKLVETAESEELYHNPLHPYTRALISAALPTYPDVHRDEIILPGGVPSSLNPPSGCRFYPRCSNAKPICSQEEPKLRDISSGHEVACHFTRDDNEFR